MADNITYLEKRIIDTLYDMRIEYEDACGIMAFLERSEEKQQSMMNFLQSNPNADIQQIYDELYDILENFEGDTNIEWIIN